jgi:hypothetical protein
MRSLAAAVTVATFVAVAAPAAHPLACDPGRSFLVQGDAPIVAPVAGPTADWLAFGPVGPAPVAGWPLPVWRAATGTQAWQQTLPADAQPLTLRSDVRLDATAGDDVVLLHVADVAGCESIVATSRRGSDGTVLARSTVTSTRPPGSGTTSLASHVDGDLTGDGRTDVVAEIRDVAAPAPAQVISPGGRLVSPGAATGGRVVVVNGTTASAALDVPFAPGPGPGPMARVAQAGGTPALVTLTNVSLSGAEATVRLAARGANGATLWTTTARTLRDPLDALPVTGGVAFVTTVYDAVALGVSPGIPSTARATVVDAATGAVRWTADWTDGAIVVPLGGDLLVSVPRHQVLERRRASDGGVVWRVTAPSAGLVDPRLAGDLTSDGIADWVVPDSACGPAWYSGATGEAACHPELAPYAGLLRGVPDLDGDGSDDLVAMTYVGAMLGVPAAAGAVVTAINGVDGKPLWQVPLPTVQDAVHVVSVRVDSVPGNDVVLYRPNTDVVALAGRTGAEVWRRPS